MAKKLNKRQDFKGKKVYGVKRNRFEENFEAECTDVDDDGILVHYPSRGNEFNEYIPFASLESIYTKEPINGKAAPAAK